MESGPSRQRDCKAGRHEQENKISCRAMWAALMNCTSSEEGGHGAQEASPLPVSRRAAIKRGQHRTARQQAEHPHGKNIVAAPGGWRNLQPMEGHFDAVGPAGLEIKRFRLQQGCRSARCWARPASHTSSLCTKGKRVRKQVHAPQARI